MKQRANRLYELRCDRKLSQIAVGIKLNLSQSRVSAYERGESIPSDILKEFAAFYRVSVDYILRISDERFGVAFNELPNSEHQLLVFYRSLSPEGREVVDGMVKGYDPDKS